MANSGKRNIQYILVFFSLLPVIVDVLLVYKLQKMECKPNLLYVTNLNCTLKPVNRYRTEMYIYVELIQILRNVRLEIVLYKKNDKNRWNKFLVNSTALLCPLLAKKGYATYPAIVLKKLRSVSNINHSCPYEKGPVIIKNLTLELNDAPDIAPRGAYKLSLNFTEAPLMNYVGNLVLYFESTNIK